MTHNIVLTLAYDGTNYLGWQKTNRGNSIKAELEKQLETILQHKILLQAASRTDAGVHASGQVVNFFTTKTLDLSRLKYSLNSMLPQDIVILDAKEMPLEFHPTLHCKGKQYIYRLTYAPIMVPHQRLYIWHRPQPLNLELLRKAAKKFLGTHDFSAFTNTKKNEIYENHIRTVTDINIEEKDPHIIEITISGNHFLYKMVRNIVGTLVYIANGKIDIDELQKIFLEKNRTLAGMTAPAHGLTLAKVFY